MAALVDSTLELNRNLPIRSCGDNFPVNHRMARFFPKLPAKASLAVFSGLLCLLPVIAAHGQVVAWGRNPYGETNVPANVTNVVTVAAGGYSSAAIRADGILLEWGLASLSPMPAGATNIVAAALGIDVNLALRADGTVFSWGNSAGLPWPLTNAVAIGAGAFHGLAVKSDGTVVAWGQNSYGQTNVPPGLNGVVAVAGGDYHSVALKSDGTVVVWGWADKGQANVPAGLSNVVAIAATYSETLALKSDGSLVIWGTLTNVPANATNIVAITSAENHFIVLKADETLAAWGDNSYGETDIPAGLTNVIAIAAGVQHNVVLVGGGAPRFFQQPFGATVPAGLSYVFEAQASGAVPMSYQWQFNGTNLPNAHASALLLTNIQFSAQGVYSVIASNASGTVTSSNAPLAVVPLIITSQPTNQTVFGGDNVTMAVSAIGYSLTYAWSFNGTNLPGQTNLSLVLSNVTVSQAGNYAVLATSAYGSIQSSNAQLSAVPLAITSQPGDQNIYEGDDAVFAVAAVKNGPFNYQWRFNGGNLPDQTNATLALSIVSTNQAGIYSVLVANPYGSMESSNAQLTVNLPYITSHPAGASVYGGDNQTFGVSAAGARLNYQWQFNGTNLPNATNTTLTLLAVTTNQAGIYSAFVSNPYRTLTSSNATLTVTPLTITTQPTSRSAYVGDSTTFSVTAFKNGPFTYQWRFQSVDLPGKTNASLTLTGLVTNNAGWYSVFISNPYGSLESSGANLNVLDSAPIITAQPVTRGAYLNGSASFQVTADGTKPLSYQWLFNGTNILNANNASLTLTNLASTNAGNYSVLVSNVVGSTLSSNASLVFLNVTTWGQTNNNGLQSVPLDLTNAVAVAVGNSHSVALKSNGRVVVWGYNGSGQTNVPASATNVIAIAAAQDHTLALRTNGTVVAWGSGGIGVPAGLSNVIAVAAGDYHSMALKADGTVVAWGDGGSVNTAATNVPANATNIVAIAAGGNFCVALRQNGTVISWGTSYSFAGITNAVAIAASEFPIVVLKADGKVHATNTLAAPAGLSNAVGVVAQRYTASALKSDGTVTNWGGGGPVTPAGLTNVSVLASGQYHCLAILGSGPQPGQIPFTNLNRISNSFSLSTPSQPGHLYWLEYKTSLTDTNWKALPLNLGISNSIILTDGAATNSMRVYRARKW
jgi:alpha-tubulin suppressor-like RCC1 family protein